VSNKTEGLVLTIVVSQLVLEHGYDHSMDHYGVNLLRKTGKAHDLWLFVLTMMLPSTELPRSVPGGTDKGNPMKI
jgi:hypothetical protein